MSQEWIRKAVNESVVLYLKLTESTPSSKLNIGHALRELGRAPVTRTLSDLRTQATDRTTCTSLSDFRLLPISKELKDCLVASSGVEL